MKSVWAVLGLASLVVSMQIHALEISKDQQVRLRHLVRHDCGSCHGLTLKGGLGPALTVQALQDKSPDMLAAVIRHGRPATPMPPWKTLLSEKEIEWIVQQLRTGGIE